MADEFDNWVNAVLDEIALEGLDGITLEALWVRLADRPDFQDTIDHVTKNAVWDIIISLDDIEMYELITPRPSLVIFNRYDFVDPELGMVLEPDSVPDDIYPHASIEDEKNQVRGSCSSYYTRVSVYREAVGLSLDAVENRWGNRFVLVGNQQVREGALMGLNTDPELELTITQYCILERIGRSRYLGEVTQGHISLQIIGEEPKALFYHRKFLTRHGLVVKQIHHQKTGSQNCSGSLLHLPRFFVERRPKVLYLTERVVEILKNRPNCIAEYEEIRKELAITNSLKKLFQTIYFQRFVRTDLRLPYRVLYPDAKVSEWKLKGSDKEKMIRVIQLIDPNTNVAEISAKDDDMEFVEEDDIDNIGPCEDFKMALNRCYLFQAYECMVGGGSNGYSQMELSAKLGVTKLHSRTVSRNLLRKGIVSTFMNDVGRQRVSRFRSREFSNRRQFKEVRGKISVKHSLANTADDMQENDDATFLFSKESTSVNPNEVKDNGNDIKSSGTADKSEVIYVSKQSVEAVSVPSPESGVLLTLPPKKRALAEVHDEQSLSKRLKLETTGSGTGHFSSLSLQSETMPNASSSQTSGQNSSLYTFSKSLGTSDQHNSSDPQFNPPVNFSEQSHSASDGGEQCESSKSGHLGDVETLQAVQIEGEETRQTCPSPQLDRSSCSSPDAFPSRSNSPALFSSSPVLSQESLDLEQRARSPVASQTLARCVEDVNGDSFDLTNNSYGSLEDKCSIKGELKTYFDHQKKDSYCMTYRIFTRINLILDYVRSQKVVDDYSKLLKLITEEEEKEGSIMKIDKKSLLRLIIRLKEDGYLNVFSYILTDGMKEKVICFICEKNICMGHSMIQSAIEQAKMKMFIVNKENMVNVPNCEAGSNEAIDKSVDELKAMCPNKKQKITFLYDKKIGKKYGFCPKFVRLRTLHQFLYYLIYGYEGDKNLDQKEAFDLFSEKNVLLDEALLAEMPRIYAKDMHWKMFIPPLQEHAGWPRGWTIMCDILLRLPLSIFVKIFNVCYIVPGLESYLSHPIRKHFLVKHLPVQLRNCLTVARKYIFSIHEGLQRLCYIGLIQFGPQRLKEKDQVMIYLNLRTTLLDTVSSKPGYHQISDSFYEVRSYEFTSLAKVDTYWYEMWNICLHTRLGGRMCVAGEDIILESLQNKPAMLSAIHPRNPEEAPLLDKGEVPGDKKGAGGLDSAIFSHLKRNWNWTNIHNPIINDTVTTPPGNMDKRKTRLANVKCVPVVFNKYTGIIKKSINYLQNGKFSKVTKHDKKQVTLKVIDPAIKPLPLPKRVSSRKNVVRHISMRKSRASNRPYYDDIDMHALQMMSKLRVEWSPAEDNLLLICKVASMYLCPNPRQQVIGVNVIRDVLHKEHPAAKNKTSRACQRRILYMMKNLTTSNSVAMHLEEVRQDSSINKKFKNTFSNVRNVVDSSEELESLMNDKFKMLVDILKTKSDNLMPEYRVYCTTIPDTTELFWEMFDVIKPKKALKTKGHFQEVKNVVDIKCALVNTIINSSLCCLSDKTSWAYQLFNVYQQYPDSLLRSAMAKIRADQMVSLKKSYIRLVQKSGNYLPLSSSPYQLSISYLHLIQTKYQYRIFHESYQMAKKLLDWRKKEEGGIKMEVGNGGSTATLLELMHKSQITFITEIPEQVIILDPRISELDETYARIVERYRDILQNYKPGKDYTTSSALFKKHLQKLDEDVCESAPNIDSPVLSVPADDLQNDVGVAAESRVAAEAKADPEEPDFTEYPLVDIDFEEAEAVPAANQQSVIARAASRIALFMMREELEETTVGTSQHAHDFFVVNSCQVYCSLTKSTDNSDLENEDYVLPLSKELINEVLASIKDKLIVPDNLVTEEQVRRMFEEKGASSKDWEVAHNLLVYVAGKKEIGVTINQLRVHFLHKSQMMSLSQILQLLVESRILLRSGVITVRYIHQNHIHPWVAHTFKLLRLKREKLETTQVKAVHLQENQDEDNINVENTEDRNIICENNQTVDDAIVDKCDDPSVKELPRKDHLIEISESETSDNCMEGSAVEKLDQNSRSIDTNISISESMDVDEHTETNELTLDYDNIQRQKPEESENRFSVSGCCEEEPMDASASVGSEKSSSSVQENDSRNDNDVKPGETLCQAMETETDESSIDSVGVQIDKPLDFDNINTEIAEPDECPSVLINVPAITHETDASTENDNCNKEEEEEASLTVNQDSDTYHRYSRLPRNLRKKLRYPRTCSGDELSTSNPQLMRFRAHRKAFVESKEMKRAAEKLNFDASEKIKVAIRPWIRINGSLNRRVLDRMLGAILGHSMFQPGQSIMDFGNRFSPALQPYHVRELLEILQKLGCVKLYVVRLSSKTTLFSKPSSVELDDVNGTENENEVIVEPQPDAVMRLGQFIGNKAYARDFMSC